MVTPPPRLPSVLSPLFYNADTAAAEAAALVVTERRKEAARAALTGLVADNSPQAAKDGIAMLRMLVANLVKQPNVPRYRRITTRYGIIPPNFFFAFTNYLFFCMIMIAFV